jgi:hypothetical protein
LQCLLDVPEDRQTFRFGRRAGQSLQQDARWTQFLKQISENNETSSSVHHHHGFRSDFAVTFRAMDSKRKIDCPDPTSTTFHILSMLAELPGILATVVQLFFSLIVSLAVQHVDHRFRSLGSRLRAITSLVLRT